MIYKIKWGRILIIFLIFLALMPIAYFLVFENNQQSDTKIDKVNSCIDLKQQDVIGKWVFEDLHGELANGSMNIKSDHSLELTGWKDQEFRSQGTWTFDESTKTFNLSFVDNKSFWQNYMDPQSQEFVEEIKEVNSSNASVRIEISRYSQEDNSCQLYLKFFGWDFRKE